MNCLVKVTSKFLCACLLGSTITLVSPPAEADINRKQAAAIASKQGGKVLKVTPIKHNGKKAFRVKVLTPSGKIVQLVIDGNSGKVIRGR
ncbi:PepSY domain-containing protein [Porticoccus sp. W117]|uniref:PepSY domain-containing protein n=1 Tax=Porticoccus sp. W117 TaxID=3054777 RepID=UPI0025931E8F|nr:PepSY domain-containing protein [Porticoccus sp. W117]MDM3870324.1 PepSY domain-containing protein [Porticoccus sp. W117]